MSSLLASETGTFRKKWKDRLPVALLYPNQYPLAVSNLGFQIVYAMLNGMDTIVCERFVYPEQGQPFRSLESSRPLTDFPLVFVSVSFEQDYPRVAAMLAAGGVAPFAADRSAAVAPGDPLVVMGGVGVFMNPEPLALFADLMVIGEAEPILGQLMAELDSYAACERPPLLRRIAAALPGCYVPSAYTFSFHPTGEVACIEAAPGMPERITRVYTPAPAVAAHSTLTSPQAELSMHMVELGRGCSRGCRFCAAGFIYRPPRLWSGESVLRGIAERPDHLHRLGLLGMEMADTATLDHVAGYLAENACALSFSSLRADRISDQVLDLLAASRLSSVAIAADGCSERLRVFINKGLRAEDLLVAAERLVTAGIFHLKLYVMIGLPTETQADLDELVTLVGELQARILPIGRARGRVSELTLSVNCFVPKPWTPFQYCPFGGLDAPEAEGEKGTTQALVALKEKIKYLRQRFRDKPNLRLKIDSPEQALEQAVYSRADRRIGPALLDIGTGRRSFKQALRQHGLDAFRYAVRPRVPEEHLCWEIVDHGIRPGYLYAEYERAMRGLTTVFCQPDRCTRCGVCHAD